MINRLIKFLAIFVNLHIFCFAELPSSQIQYPKITFTYDWRSSLMDCIGEYYFNSPVTNRLQEELHNYLPLWSASWEKEAPFLFKELFSIFQRGIKTEQRTAMINLSHGSSYGSPLFLVFGLRWWLPPEKWIFPINREEAFSVLVFHELLHIWIDENINKKHSSILTKYKNENSEVLDHLHLMAIQKMIYLRMNRSDILEYLDESYTLHQGPFYRRAWEIVDTIEGYQTIIQDIIIQ